MRASVCRCPVASRSDQSRTADRNVASACGSGTSPENPGKSLNSRFRPAVTSGPSSSLWSEKNGNGAEAAHSWPMNRSGVSGATSRSAVAARKAAAETSWWSRVPVGRLPTWSWFWTHTTHRSRPTPSALVPRGAPVRRVGRPS